MNRFRVEKCSCRRFFAFAGELQPTTSTSRSAPSRLQALAPSLRRNKPRKVPCPHSMSPPDVLKAAAKMIAESTRNSRLTGTVARRDRQPAPWRCETCCTTIRSDHGHERGGKSERSPNGARLNCAAAAPERRCRRNCPNLGGWRDQLHAGNWSTPLEWRLAEQWFIFGQSRSSRSRCEL